MGARKYVRKVVLLVLLGAATALVGQSTNQVRAGATDETSQYQPQAEPPLERPLPQFAQMLDSASAALGKVPADPLLESDPLGFVTRAADMGGRWLELSSRLRFGATYTFLNQYATVVPDTARRHDQLSGRLDFTGNWSVYDHESTAGSIGLLVRSGTNIGMSQQWNLSDQMGSGIFLNCLQGGGAQRPITVNILYWRQDFMHKRLSFYVGKLHPNQYVSLSFYNNDERTQFLNGENDGNLAIASDGTYAGGGAVDFQMTHHFYLHALAIDTVGAQQTNIKTLADKKYLEGVEFGWFDGAPGSRYLNIRVGVWRDDTKNLGSGHGVGIGLDHEFSNGWAPFGRYGFATETGTAIRQTDTLGLTNVRPFGRRGDMFGAAFNYIQPNHTGKRHESIFETFYRIRLTKSMEVGPDVQVSINPMYAAKAYTSVLLNARMRIIF
ncbi:carbohydrate porin [Tunturibacter empetritectus]|uniref:Porin n=1 Tax=Tunturiibacter empetritectus TaxID=3069691 RepID=A0A7W8IEW2_9BACT|nr:carbohydrate porin [Edaphobacter lichenicola]MBB5315886.1 porin [Edaphobacter lichenicola]